MSVVYLAYIAGHFADIDLLRLIPSFNIARSLVSRLLEQGIREGARFLLASFMCGAVSGFERLADARNS